MSVVAAHLYRNGKKAKAVSLDEPSIARANPNLSGSDYSNLRKRSSSNSRRIMDFIRWRSRMRSRRTRCRRSMFMASSCSS